MEKYWTAGCLIILSLVTSFQERQWHWQFALQFLFPALHGQWPRPPFRMQAPLHGQETSTDPWLLVLFNKDAKLQFKKNWRMDENMVDQHFHLLRNARKDFLVPSSQQPIHKRLLPRNLLNQWIHLIPYRIKTYRTVLNRIILISSSNSSEKTQKVFWDNVTR